MSGSKNRGQVRNKLTKLGYYKPEMASVNFAVPDTKTLFIDGNCLSSVIQPTKCINESFDLINKEKEHVLVYDMKKVVNGFEGYKGGDEDIWNCEGPPTLEQSYNRLQEELNLIKDIKIQCDGKNLELLSFYCSRLINVISNSIRDIHKVEKGHQRLLDRFQRDNKCSELTRSYVKLQIYNCKECIKQSLNVNRDLCQHLSKMNGTEDVYIDLGTVNLMKQQNYDILLNPEHLVANFDL